MDFHDIKTSTNINITSHNMWCDDIFATVSWKMLWELINKGTAVERRSVRGLIPSDVKLDDLIAKVTDHRVLLKMSTSHEEAVFVTDLCTYHLELTRTTSSFMRQLSVFIVGERLSVNTFAAAMKVLLIAPAEERNVIKTLMRGPGGLEIATLGMAGMPLERNNYDDDVVTSFDHIVQDIARQTPCGKLVILDGPPGTGKTFLIRGLIESARAEFVFIPPNLVSSLAGPEIVTTLANERIMEDTEKAPRPFVLIVEDADECLQERASDNLGSISSLLNMTDGIVGAALDIRVIASTNMNIKNMKQDVALLRPGRLCRRIHVGELSEGKVVSIAERLGVDLTGMKFIELPRTLAEIYRLAFNKKNGTEESSPVTSGVSRKSGGVGFTK